MEKLSLIDKRLLVAIDSERFTERITGIPEWPEHKEKEIWESKSKLMQLGFIKLEDRYWEWTQKAEEYEQKHSKEFTALFKEFRWKLESTILTVEKDKGKQ